MVVLLHPGPRQDKRNSSDTAKEGAANGYQSSARHGLGGSIGRGSNFLMEVNLEDLEHTSSKRQEYWLVAIQAVREASALEGLSQMNHLRRRVEIRWYVHTQL